LERMQERGGEKGCRLVLGDEVPTLSSVHVFTMLKQPLHATHPTPHVKTLCYICNIHIQTSEGWSISSPRSIGRNVQKHHLVPTPNILKRVFHMLMILDCPGRLATCTDGTFLFKIYLSIYLSLYKALLSYVTA